MGISMASFLQIAELGARIDPPANAVMLGRQSLRHKPWHKKNFRRALAQSPRYAGLVVEDLIDDSGYADKMFKAMGFGDVKTMDFSDYEGATIIHDLNNPLPKPLKNKFDFIYDGGTIEHVFNVSQALINMFDALKVGGTLVSVNGFNGWPGHGFYQFQPDLVWSFWRHMAGCEVVTCKALPFDINEPGFDLPDNKGSKKRREYDRVTPSGRVSLYYEVKKLATSKMTGIALQADYETKWQESAEEGV